MCKKSKNNLSDFDRKESFTYKEIPQHFASVRAEALDDLKEDCKKAVNKAFDGKYKAPNTKAMLQQVSGKFNPAYAELEGDYRTRKHNLEQAYANGEKDLSERISGLRKMFDDLELAFTQYSEALELATGTAPNKGLLSLKSDLDELLKQFDKLKEKNNDN